MGHEIQTNRRNVRFFFNKEIIDVITPSVLYSNMRAYYLNDIGVV